MLESEPLKAIFFVIALVYFGFQAFFIQKSLWGTNTLLHALVCHILALGTHANN